MKTLLFLLVSSSLLAQFTGGSGGGSSSVVLPFSITRTSSTQWTLNSNCTSSLPCPVRFGSKTYTFTTSPTVNISGAASGVVYFYIQKSGGTPTLFVGDATPVNSVCTGACTVNTASAIPSDAIQIGTWSVTSGSIDSLGFTDLRSIMSTRNIYAGTGIVVTESNGDYTVTAAGSSLIASGTSALGTGSISSATCATVVTTSATGVLSTDTIIWNPNASIKAVTGYVPATTGGLSIAGYPTTDNVNWDVCNWSNASITPGAVTLNWKVIR